MLYFYSIRKIVSLYKLCSAAAKCLLPPRRCESLSGLVNDVLWDGDCVRFKAALLMLW